MESSIVSQVSHIEVKIQDLLEIIADEEIKRKPKRSEEFSVGGARFRIDVYPELKTYNHIGVYLKNLTDEDQIISAEIEHCSGKEDSFKMRVVEANKSSLFTFMSHEEYKSWTKKNGDIFRVSVTLHIKDKVASSLRPDYVISSVTQPIMMDEDTADFSIHCDTKTFRVHKNFLCISSPVFRAMILGSMKEAIKGEVDIQDLDEGTLESLINFIYTGDFKISPDIDVQNMALAGDKYIMPDFSELLVYKLRNQDNIKPETIGDIILAAHRHNNTKLREVALERIRAKRSIVNDQDFRETMKGANSDLIFDLFDF